MDGAVIDLTLWRENTDMFGLVFADVLLEVRQKLSYRLTCIEAPGVSPSEIRFHAHTIGSVAGGYGFRELHRQVALARAAETSADLQALIAEVRAAFERAWDTLAHQAGASAPFMRSRETYGVPRVHAELKARGVQVGQKRVARPSCERYADGCRLRTA